MNNPPILAAAMTALTALWLTALSVNISRLRLRHRVSHGDGGHRDLLLAIRAHGNTLEQATVFLLLLLVAELMGVAPALLQGASAAFALARLAHAWALWRRRLPVRQLAHVVTVLAQLSLVTGLALRLLA